MIYCLYSYVEYNEDDEYSGRNINYWFDSLISCNFFFSHFHVAVLVIEKLIDYTLWIRLYTKDLTFKRDKFLKCYRGKTR